jgi:mannan polymerase II complex MNN11 subunit
LKGSEIDLALSQDNEGLAPGSFIIRNGEWAQFFLDTWYDPLYRSYNFVRAEIHALVSCLSPGVRCRPAFNICQEHIVQWHPTVLSKIALIPQRALNAYNSASTGKESRYQEEELKYAEGDFVVRFPGCTVTGPTSCEAAAQPFLSKWRAAFSNA